MRLRALNESSSDDSAEEGEERETIEAQEERAFSLYKNALELRQQGHYSNAEQLLISLLNEDFLANVSTEDDSTGADVLARPAAALKYACLKNLGNVLVLQSRAEDGLKCFIQAVELDESDVTMWHQIGSVALQIDDFHLASQAFQEGLRCNAHHWPCLDSLLPVLYALNDYLGCLLLVSRTLELDPEYPQALALRNQISKDDPNLLKNFKSFFPSENDISEVSFMIPEEESFNLISYALSLQERSKAKNAAQSAAALEADWQMLNTALQLNTWENLSKTLLEAYNSIACSSGKSYLQLVKIGVSGMSKLPDVESPSKQNIIDKTEGNNAVTLGSIDIESEAMDVDSEQDAKGEDQTEEDATEASGLEQDEEARVASAVVQQNASALKRKRKRSSITLMDQWSKRRSGRRTGRKVEDREESNLASCFRSLLPLSLLPKNLEAELAKASKRRSLRDPVELLAWGDDSMDTIELCRLLQERDAKDERQREVGQHVKNNITQQILKDNYFGTENESSDVCAFIEKHGSGTHNIIQLLSEFNRHLAEKSSITWPSGLVLVYIEVYECKRRHMPCPSPLDSAGCANINAIDVYEALLYCELYVDLWQQKNQSDQDILGENGLLLAEALGNVMLLSGLTHIFSSPLEQCRILLRVHWLKVHLFLLQDDSPSAIHSLHNVLESLEIIEVEDAKQENETRDVSLASPEDIACVEVPCKVSEKDEKRKPMEELESNSGGVDASQVCVSKELEIAGSSVDVRPSVQSLNPSVQGSNSDAEEVVSLAGNSVSETNIQMLDTPQQDTTPGKLTKSVSKSETESALLYENTDIGTKNTAVPDSEPVIANPNVDCLSTILLHQVKEEKADSIVTDTDFKALEDDATHCLQQKETRSLECLVESTTTKIEEEPSAVENAGAVINSVSISGDVPPCDELDPLEFNLNVITKNKNGIDSSDPKNVTSNKPNVLQNSEKLSVETDLPAPSKNSTREEGESIESSVPPTAKTKSPIIFLPNCCMNQEINKRTVQKLLTSLTRQQQLSEVDDLYQNGHYELLAGTLTECFKYCAQQADSENSEVENLPDRSTQMAMLLDSLWQLQKYSDCFYWTEACLHEAFNRYLNSNEADSALQDQDDHQMWATTVERLLAGLNGCLKVAGPKLMEKLPKACLTRLVQTLTSILCQQLEQSDCSVEMAIECTTPWVILHRIVFFEEQNQPTCQGSIPSHMRVLFRAHECMSKKGRCCLNEGVLLNLILDIVVPQLQSEDLSAVHGMLIHEVEQAILCLYGHPKKPSERSKKRLQDHKVHQQLELTWERSLTLLRFYQPYDLPTFDSSTKICPEEEQLFLRILPLVPNDVNPSHHLGKMKAFLQGSVDTLPESQCSNPESVWNLYYLLADYYLKTFKWEPAVKYYMLDVCLNPHRFDSWAGMALARATLLTLDMTSCNTLDNDVQLCRKTAAQLCFQKALDLDPENTTLWIEFGSFAYTVHSFCSRLLKTETESLSMEMFTKIEEEKDKMLSLTEQCFKTAERLGQDEPWLPQYMLGKVAEKQGEGPIVFLQHYRAAAKLLFESSAEYPLTLNYDPPEHYAFEAHEVYYRIHASMLKHLESVEGKCLSEEILDLYKKTLDEAAKGPFMAVRGLSQLSLMNCKRPSVDPSENAGKRIKLDELTVLNVFDGDCTQVKPDTRSGDLQYNVPSNESSKLLKDIDMKDNADNISQMSSGKSVTLNTVRQSSTVKRSDAAGSELLKQSDYTVDIVGNKPDIVLSNKSDVSSNGRACQPDHAVKDDFDLNKLPAIYTANKMDTNCEVNAVNICSSGKIEEKSDSSSPKETVSENKQMNSATMPKSEEGNLGKKELISSNMSDISSSSGDSNKESENVDASDKKQTSVQKGIDVSKETKDTAFSKKPVHENQPSLDTSSDHSDLVNQCLVAMEECLVRYPRHYKSLYRLCHHYFRSKQHRNLKKCRQLLLGDYRMTQVNKTISGLFKSASVNSMFNDVWRLPIEEIDRPGSFAFHMSRCVHLLMELLRALRDHAYLLKLSVFLKREPEKKEKKYLRDNERIDLSKQALVMCLAAMRECVNETRTVDHVIELYRTVKDGLKELPLKEAAFKGLLSDAYKKLKGLSKAQGEQQSYYEIAADLCLSELNLRKATADVKAKAQMQVHAQIQAQVQAQAMKMGVNVMPSTLAFNPMAPRYPAVVNTPLVRTPLANAQFLHQMPGYRGRGRAPKAQQRLHNAMMNMAQIIGLANTSGQSAIDPLKPKVMKPKQRGIQQQSTSSQSTVVSSIIKDRPALSITALHGNKTTGQNTAVVATASSASIPAAPIKMASPLSQTVGSGVDAIQSGPAGWPARPRHSLPSPMTPSMPGATDPRAILNSTGISRMQSVVRKDGPRHKSILNASPATNIVPRAFVPQSPGPFTPQPQSSMPLSNPTALLSRLPGLQVKQRPSVALSTSNHQEPSATRQQLQPIERLQKINMSNSQSSKPFLSISKVATSLSPLQGSNGADKTEARKKNDPNFDIITLD